MSLSPELEADLKKLASSLQMAEGEFTLIFAHCNYLALQNQLAERLAELTEIATLRLTAKHQTLSEVLEILKRRGTALPPSVQVLGLETMTDLPGGLAKIDQTRAELKKRFPLPIVVWVNDALQSAWLRYAPNMESWGVPKGFTLSNETVTTLIDDKTQQLLEAGWQLSQQEAEFLLPELKKAREGLGGENLSEKTQAQLAALIGLATEQLGDWQSAVNCYQQGLAFESVWSVEAKGLLYRNFGWCGLGLTETDSEQIGQCLEISCSHLVSANREDWWRVSFPGMALTLMSLQQWEGLKRLLETGKNSFGQRESQVLSCLALGYQAVINWQQGDQTQAMTLVQEADNCWDKDKNTVEHFALLCLGSEILEAQENWQAAVDWIEQRCLGMMSNLLLEKIDTQLPRVLEPEQRFTKIYLDISQRLQRIYFQHLKDYRKAFVYSQSEVRFKQQIGDYAFIGANRMEAIEGQKEIATALTAAGRDQDVSALVERILQNDHKLIVLYGESGVGKSSLLQAGLVPKLKQQRLGQGTLFPVYLRLYDDKLTELKRGLEVAENTDWEGLTAQVQEWDRQNRRVIFIFDQFEEFFFANVQQQQQSAFFNWLGTVLKVLTTKVVLSLRKDYLHLLVDFSHISPDQSGILAAQNLYELRNFTGVETRQLIERLTAQSQFQMSPQLVKRVVEDLTGEEERIRPIELQILGAQCQEGNITDLVKYEQAGGKARLLQSYVDRVTRACGPESADLAGVVLFLLTDEQDRRLFKTGSALAEGLEQVGQRFTPGQLDLVLEILVRSGLVVELPEEPVNRFQILHDYLVPLIRKKQAPMLAALAAELEQEKAQRIKAENELAAVQTDIEAAKQARAVLEEDKLRLQNEQTSLEKQNQDARKRLKLTGLIAVGILGAAAVGGIWTQTELNKAADATQNAQQKEKIATKLLNENKQKLELTKQGLVNAQKKQEDATLALDNAKKLKTQAEQKLKNANVDLVQANQERVRIKNESDKEIAVAIQRISLARQAVIQAQIQKKRAEIQRQQAEMAVAQAKAKQQELAGQAVALRREQATLQAKNREAQGNLVASQIQALTTKAEALHLANPSRIDALLTSLEAGHLLKTARTQPSSPQITAKKLPTALILNQIQQDVKQHNELNAQSTVYSVAVVAGENQLVSGSEDGKVRVWDLTSHSAKPLHTFDAESLVISVAVVAGGNQLVSGSYDGKIQVWDLTSHSAKPLHTFDAESPVYSLAVVAGGNQLVSGSADGKVRVWDLTSNSAKPVHNFDAQSPVSSVAVVAGGNQLVSGSSDGKVRVWDLTANPAKPLHTFDAQSPVRSVAVVAGRNQLVSGSEDGKIQVWDLTSHSAKPLHTFDAENPVYSLAVVAGGNQLVSGSYDGKIQVWDLTSHSAKPLHTFDAQSQVNSVAVVAGGNQLVSGSYDGKVRVWDLDLDRLMGSGCRWARDYLESHPEKKQLRDICQEYY